MYTPTEVVKKNVRIFRKSEHNAITRTRDYAVEHYKYLCGRLHSVRILLSRRKQRNTSKTQ